MNILSIFSNIGEGDTILRTTHCSLENSQQYYQYFLFQPYPSPLVKVRLARKQRQKHWSSSKRKRQTRLPVVLKERLDKWNVR